MAVPAQELEKLDKLAGKAPLPVELAGKYQASSWDAHGFPTADKEGAPLSEKVRLVQPPIPERGTHLLVMPVSPLASDASRDGWDGSCTP